MERESLCNRQLGTPHAGRIPAVALMVCASLAHCVTATEIPIAPEPVGSGARALGQSAFIAVADDATAASWNPAGLINLENPEASFVGVGRTITNDISSTDSAYDGQSWSLREINFASIAYPIAVRSGDVVLSANYHQVYDLGLEYQQRYETATMKSASEGAICAYSLAGGFSIRSHPELTIGMAFNWYAQSLLNDNIRQVTWESSRKLPSGTEIVTFRTEETLDDFHGYNFTFGLLWDAYEREENLLTLGFVCQTPFRAEMDMDVMDIDNLGQVTHRTDEPVRLDMDFPLSLGFGAHYRFSDSLSTALDVQWTQWSEYTYDTATWTPGDDAAAVRLGFEQLWFPRSVRQSVLAWRGGVFYEPRPAWSGILPVYGVSVGLGWTVKEQFSIDLAYQFRWGQEDLRFNRLRDDGTVITNELDYEVEEHWLIGSVIVYF